MRSWYVSRRNESILNARVMALFAAALVLILVWLAPREQTFRDMLANQEADRVSIAYARLLLGISPEDDDLRKLLARQYYELGELDNAWHVLKDSGADSVLGLKILQKITYAEEPGKSRDKWRGKLTQALQRVATADDIDVQDLREFASIASSLNKPRLAAGLRERVYLASEAEADLREAAQAWVAANAPEYAVKLLMRDGYPKNEDLLKLAIQSAMATGDPELSLSIIDAYLEDQSSGGRLASSRPSVDLVAHLVRALLAANKATRVPEVLAMLPATSELTLSQSVEFASAAVASGELALAKTFMERALVLKADDSALLRRLAQVYEWSGQPEDALVMWMRASEASDEESDLQRAWRLGKSLYQYRNVGILIGKISEIRRLTDEEVGVLRLAWEQYGDPKQGEQVLKAYLRRQPDHRQAWQQLITLQTNNLEFPEADDSWREFNMRHILSIAENQAWADIKWRRYHARGALNILLQREPAGENTAYWRQLAAYAWFLDEPAITTRAMQARLASGERLNSFEMQQLIQGDVFSNPEMVAAHAQIAWENDPEMLEFLFTALYAAIEMGDLATADELFSKAIANEDLRELLDKNANFWTLRANHLQQQGDNEGAQLALTKALEINPDNPELQANQLWLRIAQNNRADLRLSLPSLANIAPGQPVLWAPMASAYALLYEHKKAIPWFARAIERDTTDIGLLLAYSGSLDAIGRRDPAYRLRRHTLKLLAAQSANGQQASNRINADTVIVAGRGILTGPEQRLLLQQLLARAPLPARASWTERSALDGGPSGTATDIQTDIETADQKAHRLASIARFEFSNALSRSHYSAARYWLGVGARASAGDRLILASDEHDESALTDFAQEDDYELSSLAALALGQPGFAMNRTLEELQRNPRNQTALNLRESLSRELRPSGWQATPTFEELGDFRFVGAELLFSRRFERFHIDTRLRQQNTTVNTLEDTQSFAETGIDTAISYRNRWGAGSLGIDYTKGSERSLLGLNWQQDFQIDRRNNLVLAIERDARGKGGGVNQALLNRSGARLDWNTGLSQRLQLNTSVMTGTIKDQDRNRIGDVTQFTFSPNYILSHNGPTINLRGQAQWISSSQQNISAALAGFLRSPDQEVLPGDTRSLTIGGVISRDEPGALDWRRSGIHYRFSADVGYRWPQKNLTFNSEAALAVPLFGRDRLAASVTFTNSLDNEVSETGIRAQLTYSRRLK